MEHFKEHLRKKKWRYSWRDRKRGQEFREEREREGKLLKLLLLSHYPINVLSHFAEVKNQSDELYVPLQDTCSFGKVAKVWAATRDRNLSTYLPQSLHMVSGAHKASYSLDNGWNVIWSKTAGAWSWRVTPFIYEVMEEWSHNCLLPIYLYDIHRQNFTVAHGI